MSNRKNKLRGERNIKLLVYICVVLFLLLLMFGLYFAYIMVDYEFTTGEKIKIKSEDSMKSIDIESIKSFFSYFSAPKLKAPINSETILLCFKYQATRLWWMYAIVALTTFLMVTSSSSKDEYKGMEHGSGSWADKYDKKEFNDTSGIPVGLNTYVTVNNPQGKSYEPHNLNEIVIGGSGAGKSFRKIQPDIMQMVGSYVVTDPKGELYRNTAKFLKANGYKVKVLNLQDINLSNSYNPFKYMSEEQDVINIADLFMKNTAGEGEKEDFWAASAQDLLVAIMVYLWKTDYELKTFGRVIRLVNSVKYQNGAIDELCELARCFKNHCIEHPNDVVAVNWKGIQGTPQETFGSICKTLSTRLRLWAVEDVDELTATDEMDFDSIGKEKTAIFMITKVPRNPYKAISNIFYSQLFERLMLVANRDYNGKLPLLVSCEIDEFANLGVIPNFTETLSVVRSHNVRICIVLQGLSQLKAMYDKKWDSIIGNCSIFNFLGTVDQDSKEYVSKRLGKTTVRVDSRSFNRGNHGGGSDSESYVQRDLLSPDEIPQVIRSKGKTKKYGGSSIVFVDEFKPFFFCKYDTMSHSLFEQTGSSFPKGKPNNTYIEQEYACVKKKRHELHQNMLTDFFARTKAEEEEAVAKHEADEAAKEAAEQEELDSLYPDDEFPDNETDLQEEQEISEDIEIEIEQEDDINPIMNEFSFSEGDDE